jgi:hypothetical protein
MANGLIIALLTCFLVIQGQLGDRIYQYVFVRR